MDSKTTAGGSWPLASLLTIVFVTLKLCHVIEWSWWWVVSPLWIAAIVFAFVVGLLVVAVVVKAKENP